MRQLLIADLAQQDLVSCLSWTLKNFGEEATERYESLLFHSFQKLLHDPVAQGSKCFESSIYLFHIRYCKDEVSPLTQRVKRSRHFIAYRFSEEKLEILRILHDSMDLESHLESL